MAKRLSETIRKYTPFVHSTPPEALPEPLPEEPGRRLVHVYVEGYEDVAFWRGIFDHFQDTHLRFEISVPNRKDLPKGKKVLLSMIPQSSEELLLCVDSDFDYLFNGCTEQSKEVNDSPYMFHTYAYATENYVCYAPSLHNVCVRATMNDTRIFDFVQFMEEYSRIIYPVFLWYAYSAQQEYQHAFTLADFKTAVRLGYLKLADNGSETLAWLKRNVEKREEMLRRRNPQMIEPMKEFEQRLIARGLTRENCYLFMQGHTLMDNVVMVLLNTVCEKLRNMTLHKISSSRKQGVALKNELSNFNNAQRSIRDVLLDNENYTSCPLYRRLHSDLERYIAQVTKQMK